MKKLLFSLFAILMATSAVTAQVPEGFTLAASFTLTDKVNIGDEYTIALNAIKEQIMTVWIDAGDGEPIEFTENYNGADHQYHPLNFEVKGKNIKLYVEDPLQIKSLTADGLSYIDLSQLSALQFFTSANGSLTKLDLSNYTNFEELGCSDNNLTFATLKLPANKSCTLKISPQKPIEINKSYTVAQKIDLSHTGAETYKWMTKTRAELVSGTDYSIENGVTTFKKNFNDVYCEMTHSDFPELTLKTTMTSISQGTGINEDQSTAKVEGIVGAIRITTDQALQFEVRALSGIAIANGEANGETAVSVPQGIYIVKVDNTTHKVIVK